MPDPAVFARAAFALGLAGAGPDAFPITAATRLDALAVQAAARACPGSLLVEQARQAGTRAGVIATIKRRRERLHEAHIKTLAPIVAGMARTVNIPDLTHAMITGDRLAVRGVNRDAAAAEIARRVRMEEGLLSAWRNHAAAAQHDAWAAGGAAALALLAGTTKNITADQAALNAQNPVGLAPADTWVSAQIGGAGADAATAFGGGNGPSTAPTTDTAVLGAGVAAAVASGAGPTFHLDENLAAAFFAGGVSVYSDTPAVQMVEWDTMGDARVCGHCLMNAAGSPYRIGDLPGYPAHFGCRCFVSPL